MMLPRNQSDAVTPLLNRIAVDMVEACSIDSMMLKQSKVRGDPNYVQIPVSLFPTPYPIDMYKEAYSYQHAFGDLLGSLVAAP